VKKIKKQEREGIKSSKDEAEKASLKI